MLEVGKYKKYRGINSHMLRQPIPPPPQEILPNPHPPCSPWRGEELKQLLTGHITAPIRENILQYLQLQPNWGVGEFHIQSIFEGTACKQMRVGQKRKLTPTTVGIFKIGRF
jgi:hypothetical protein